MSEDMNETLAEQIRESLRLVIDPELGYNIVDLGLVYDIDVEGGCIASIVMTTTTKGCPATDYLKNGAHESAAGIAGIKFVDVSLTYEPPWTPRMMTPEAKQYLGIQDGGGW